MFFEDNIDDAKYGGHLYGLGTPYQVNGGGSQDAAGAEPTTSSG